MAFKKIKKKEYKEKYSDFNQISISGWVNSDLKVGATSKKGAMVEFYLGYTIDDMRFSIWCKAFNDVAEEIIDSVSKGERIQIARAKFEAWGEEDNPMTNLIIFEITQKEEEEEEDKKTRRQTKGEKGDRRGKK